MTSAQIYQPNHYCPIFKVEVPNDQAQANENEEIPIIDQNGNDPVLESNDHIDQSIHVGKQSSMEDKDMFDPSQSEKKKEVIRFQPMKNVFELLCDDANVPFEKIPDCLPGETKTGKSYKVLHNNHKKFLSGENFTHLNDDKVRTKLVFT